MKQIQQMNQKDVFRKIHNGLKEIFESENDLLSDEQREICRLRFCTGEFVSRYKVAEQLNITEERVKTLEEAAFKKIVMSLKS